ncbi:SAM-dependent methyltransferase [Candidatus Micrarchaeota archaeon]|nr:MAG: SAM-dependent methyltransferase [Candidatus Micrarchaeota archaeon]
MARIEPFEKYPSRYEDWFNRNKFVYETELQAIRKLLPKNGKGIEIGVGSGRFAAPLGVKLGVEPSRKMREFAQKRGIEVVDGVAEKLPFEGNIFDFVLMVTTICFVDDIDASFREAYRVLLPGGSLIIGFIDKNSNLGKIYQEHKAKSVFYKIATFYSITEVVSYLKKAGFKDFEFVQTIFHNLTEIKSIEPVKKGYGEGSFVVVKAIK